MAQEISPRASPRIALISGSLVLGGTTTFLCNLGGELVRRNIAANVFSLTKANPLATDFERERISVHCEDERESIFEDRMVSILGRLADLQPTVVVANLSASSFEALRYVPAGVFRIGTVQSDDSKWYAMLQHYVGHLDMVAAVSETIQERVQALPGFAQMRVAYLPYGVPMPEIAVRAETRAPAPLRILYLGRLEEEQKRVRLFPIIQQMLEQSKIPYHWTIAGEGPERDALQSAMTDGRMGKTIFIGKVAYADVPRLLAQHDLFLLVSTYEGLPLSLLEAMGHGLVPVVSDLPSGIRSVVDDTTGIRVAVDNIAGYAEAIGRLHRNRTELTALAGQAQKRVRQDYSVAAMTDRWLATFPPTPHAAPLWKPCPAIEPILGTARSWRFSPPGRWLRRLVIKTR